MSYPRAAGVSVFMASGWEAIEIEAAKLVESSSVELYIRGVNVGVMYCQGYAYSFVAKWSIRNKNTFVLAIYIILLFDVV